MFTDVTPDSFITVFDANALTLLYRMPGYNFSPSMEDCSYFLPYSLTNVYKKAQIKNRPVWPSLARTSSRLFVARNPLKDCHLRKVGPAISKRSLPALHSFCFFCSFCFLLLRSCSLAHSSQSACWTSWLLVASFGRGMLSTRTLTGMHSRL